MKCKQIAIVGVDGEYRELVEKTLRAADTRVYVFAGQTGLFRSGRGRCFDLAVVRVTGEGIRALSTIAKIRTRSTAEKVVAVIAEDIANGTPAAITDGCEAIVREPYGYADLIEAVAALIAPNELLETQTEQVAAP
jgi:DNA-binding response OmpR family regulator